MISRKKNIVSRKIGMMRHFDGSLHYTINGEDQGVACEFMAGHNTYTRLSDFL